MTCLGHPIWGGGEVCSLFTHQRLKGLLNRCFCGATVASKQLGSFESKGHVAVRICLTNVCSATPMTPLPVIHTSNKAV